jgi:glycosyltransferase involved in cell wall biosynthesis
MKVLHVISTGQRRGAEMFAADLIRSLNGRVEHRVAVLRGESPMPAGYDAPTSTLERGARVPGARIEIRSLRSLADTIRAWEPDIVQAHGNEPFKYTVLASRRKRVRVAYRRIGLAPDRVTHGMARIVHGWLMRRSHRVVAVANAVRQETISTFRVPEEKVVTIPRGVDRMRLRPIRDPDDLRAEMGIASGTPVVLSLGALTWEKDPTAHLAAMTDVRRQLPDAVHLLAGDGPLRPEVERAVASSGDRGRAYVLGARDDVAELLAISDVVLLASRSEGMPGCLIEAGMVGVPAVAYAVAGVPEVVIDGVTGFTAARGDTATLADRVVTLLAEPTLRATLGAGARAHCETSFEITVVADAYVTLWEELAA